MQKGFFMNKLKQNVLVRISKEFHGTNDFHLLANFLLENNDVLVQNITSQKPIIETTTSAHQCSHDFRFEKHIF